jgi:hypothetical protein
MRKMFNFIVLLILIKRNKCKIKDRGELKILYSYYSSYKNRNFSYYFNDKFFGKIIFCKVVWEDSITYEVLKDECKFELWNWQAKFLYKMAQNKYFQTRNKIF